MIKAEQMSLAERFRTLNRNGNLLLPNAWDGASARVFEEAGFPAIGTTSAGIAYTRGCRDGQRIERNVMMREISVIVNSVRIPVTADIEAGYGPQAAHITETVEAFPDVGVAGINLEDNTHGSESDPLYSIDAQVARIAAAREVADRRGIAMVINGRTDTFLAQVGSNLEERTDITIKRGLSYLKAGADLVFVPLLVDSEIVRQLVAGIRGPVSLMIMPGAPSAKVLFAAGAARLSIGQTAMLASLGAVRAIADEMKEKGTWNSIEQNFYGFGEAESLFALR